MGLTIYHLLLISELLTELLVDVVLDVSVLVLFRPRVPQVLMFWCESIHTISQTIDYNSLNKLR